MTSHPQDGWVGHLTADQEAKLKELWEVLLKIGGVSAAKTSTEIPDGASATNGASADGSGKKKKRFGLFRRSAGGEEVNGDDPEDKYGQNKEFKQALADQTPEEVRETIWSFTKADDPDALLLRYLRARKWNVQNALVMLIATNHWRKKEVRVDDELIKHGEAWFLERSKTSTGADKKMGEDFMAQLRMGKSFVHGTDAEGRPISWVRARLHRGGDQSAEAIEKFTVYTIETCRMMLGPGPPSDTGAIIFDMSEFSMANMDYTPVKFMIKIFEANYPESLGHICVHRSPWIFHSIWTIIRGWLDPVVASKVHFTKDAHELSSFIPLSHIPQEMGGEEDYVYTYKEPVPGENDAMKDDAARQEVWRERWQVAEEYETETLKWCRGEGDEKEVVQRRKELAEALRKNYWKLDPYVRARTLYDREGLIQPGGHVDMYPGKAAATETQSSKDDVD